MAFLPAHVDETAFFGRLARFEIETPSWAYANTGTRFGKFIQPAAASTFDEKLADAAEVHRVTGCCPSVAVHVLWDFPDGSDPAAAAANAARRGLRIGSINPNVFQDQCYKWGSVTNRDPAIRRRAVEHMLACTSIAKRTGSKLLSLWFADGTNYPGQGHIRQRKRWMADALREVHASLPHDLTMLVEYKPFEPAFYHTDIADWGMAYVSARHAGPQARVLVDTGHHLPGCNIEHLVAFLIDEDMLGGFHFNDRRYADDDLMLGSIDPYQIFRILAEIVAAERERGGDLPLAYMIDQSHNVEPKVEAMIRTVVAGQELLAKALMVDWDALASARGRDDVIAAEGALRDAFSTDVRPLLAEHRLRCGAAAEPLAAFRSSGYVERITAERAGRARSGDSSYA